MDKVIIKDHLPFEMPKTKHSLVQEWRFLTFMHWEVNPEKIACHLPEGIELDLYKGTAFVGLIPFMMKDVHPRLLLPIPGISNFPEFNIRTYVKVDNKPGVYFLTLDAESYITSLYAPLAYGLPYQYAKGGVQVEGNKYIWDSRRKIKGFELSGFSQKLGSIKTSQKGSIEEFLFERYCLYTKYKNKICIGYTSHNQWTFYEAKASFTINNLTKSFDLGINNLFEPDYTHVSDGVYVNAWSLQNVS